MAGYVPTFELLKAFFATVGYDKVFREVPSNLTNSVPLLVVARFGGGDQTITIDKARVDIDAFTGSADTADQLGEDIRVAMRIKLYGYRYGGAVVGKVETMSAPKPLPWDAPNVYRVNQTYQITTHQYSGVS